MSFANDLALPKTQADRLIAEGALSEELINLTLLTPKDPVVTGAFLRALLTNRAAAEGGTSGKDVPIMVTRILRIRGARFQDKLDLSWCGSDDNPLPCLTFEDCTFMNGIDLTATMLEGMRIHGGSIRGSVKAKGACFSSDVEIKETCFEDAGEIILRRAKIGTDCRLSSLRSGRLATDTNKNAAQSLEIIQESDPPQYLALIDLKSISMGGDLVVEGTSLKARDKAADDTTDSKENEGIAINAEGAEVKGNIVIQALKKEMVCIFGQIKLLGATVGEDIEISGATVESFEKAAIVADSVIVKGSVRIQSDEIDHCHITAIRFPEANVSGQFVIQGLTVTSTVDVKEEKFTQTAIFIEGATLKADFFLQDDGKRGCFVLGEVNAIGASIDGQFAMQGVAISSTTESYAIRVNDSIIKGGFIINAAGKNTEGKKEGVTIRQTTINKGVIVVSAASTLKESEIKGEISFIRAVMGMFKVEGAILKARNGAKDEDGVALRGSGAKVNGEFLLQKNADEACSITGSMRLEGAAFDARLRILGVNITGNSKKDAIVASGATIKGGFYIEPSPSGGSTPKLTGTLRLSHTRITTRLQIKGTEIFSDNIAIAANGVVVQGDISITVSENQPSTITGEIHLFGASISGHLTIEGGQVIATCRKNAKDATEDATGFALDCYMAEISQGVSLIPSKRHPLILKGIVGFAFAKLGSLTIGAGRTEETPDPAVLLHGHLRLNQVQVHGATDLTRLELQPALFLDDQLCETVVKGLKHWLPVDTEIIALNAAHSDLGSELKIDLNPLSAGCIDLYGARVGTLEDKEALAWGQAPTGNAWSKTNRRERKELKGVRLGLNGFTFDRFHEWSNESIGRKETRIPWLRRQYPNDEIINFLPQPYLQLSKIYREQGYFREANQVAMKRRWQETKGHIDWINRIIQILFGLFFGFGYSTKRALGTLIVLFVLSGLFTWKAEAHSWLRNPPLSGTNNPSKNECSHPWLYMIDEVLPVVHLATNSGCELDDYTPRYMKSWRVINVILSWVCVPIALLTFSGVFREKSV